MMHCERDLSSSDFWVAYVTWNLSCRLEMRGRRMLSPDFPGPGPGGVEKDTEGL